MLPSDSFVEIGLLYMQMRCYPYDYLVYFYACARDSFYFTVICIKLYAQLQ